MQDLYPTWGLLDGEALELASRGERMHADFDWSGAEADLRAAIEHNPSDALGRQRLAEWLTARGRHDESLAQMELASAVDPLNAQLQANAGRLLYLGDRQDAAVVRLARASELAPRFHWAPSLAAMAHARAGRAASAGSAPSCARTARARRRRNRSRTAPGSRGAARATARAARR